MQTSSAKNNYNCAPFSRPALAGDRSFGRAIVQTIKQTSDHLRGMSHGGIRNYGTICSLFCHSFGSHVEMQGRVQSHFFAFESPLTSDCCPCDSIITRSFPLSCARAAMPPRKLWKCGSGTKHAVVYCAHLDLEATFFGGGSKGYQLGIDFYAAVYIIAKFAQER